MCAQRPFGCGLKEIAGLGHVTTHQLRHTSLTTALDNTENLRAVMEFARHERPQTTAGYTRRTKERVRRSRLRMTYRGVSDALDFWSFQGFLNNQRQTDRH